MNERSDNHEKIRAIIVDDELPARENLRFMLEDYCPAVEVCGTADGVKTALELFRKVKPELIFLDIRMPSGAEGFDLLEQLDGEYFYVVFVTAFKDYAIRAFESRALHYILKPIDDQDLTETVQRIMERRNNDKDDVAEMAEYRENIRKLEEEITRQTRPKRITIHHSKGIKLLDPDDITHVEGSGNCSLLHFRDRTSYLDTRTLKVYEVLLPNYFFRIHKSYIVNMREVSEILHGDEQSVVLKNGVELPVARERKKDLITSLQNFI